MACNIYGRVLLTSYISSWQVSCEWTFLALCQVNCEI